MIDFNPKGTIISVTNSFSLPVLSRQVTTRNKKKKNFLKNIENVPNKDTLKGAIADYIVDELTINQDSIGCRKQLRNVICDIVHIN